MLVEVKVPEVGESISEGLLAAWLRQDGDLVQVGEELFELETDKVTVSVPAEAAGRLKVLVAEETQVKIGQVVGTVDTAAGAEATPAPAAAPAPAEEPRRDIGQGPPISAPAGLPQAREKLAAGDEPPLAPAVRRKVREHGLAPEEIEGTGKRGRITSQDVERHLESRAAGRALPSAPAPAPATPSAPAAPAAGEARETRVKMTPLRLRITQRLVQVQQTAAILSTFNEADMSAVMAYRNKHQPLFEKKHGIRLGFMSFFVKAVVDALKAVPQLNARIEGDEIVQQHYYDIGVAVGTPKGLVVPVIRDADRLEFAELEQTIADLAVRARERKLTLAELTGGCFTISNGGVYGSLLSTPILNPPQSGILGMHSIKKRPVVVDDEIVIRPMMYLAVSYDHRLVDGSEAVGFLKRIVECLEAPERMLLGV